MRTAIGAPELIDSFLQGPPPSDHPWEGRFHATMIIAAGLVVVISLCGYHYWRLELSLTQATPLLLLLLLLLAGAAQYRYRGERKCFHVVMMVFWIILVTNSHYFPMYMAARYDVEMNDALLARLDQALGIEVPAVLGMIKPYPRVSQGMLSIYLTLIPLMTLAAIVPPLVNRMDLAKSFVISCILAATISLPIFAHMQAVGPWEYYGFDPPIASLAEKATMLETLKNDSVFVIDVANRDGLITFPSFHVVLTVLAAAALWPMRPLRWPVALWAGLIIVSTVATGIHYASDVVGGLLVARLTFAGGQLYLRLETGNWRTKRPTVHGLRRAAT
jgi:membrane-associated phospholipid phosphatase